MPAPSTLVLPKDADVLMAEAKAGRPELKNFRHASDAVIATNALGQSVHQTHRNLRARIVDRDLAAAGRTK